MSADKTTRATFDARRTYFASRDGLFFIDNATGHVFQWLADGQYRQITPDPLPADSWDIEPWAKLREAKP